jgi:hypothetical protein
MPISLLTKRNATRFLLCIFTAIPIARLYGQDKPQVAPPAKSDSFETDERGKKFRVQHREVAGTNFQIAGVDLALNGDLFTHVLGTLGKVSTVWSGDAADSNHEACYRSADANDSTHLIFGEGEVSRSFTLSSDGSVWKWKTPCKMSLKISHNVATASGLHLGQTQEQLIAILGLPTAHSRNIKNGQDDLVYELEARKKKSSQEIAVLMQDELKQYPNLDLKLWNKKLWIENNGYYDLSVSIYAKFVNNALIKLKVTWVATD